MGPTYFCSFIRLLPSINNSGISFANANRSLLINNTNEIFLDPHVIADQEIVTAHLLDLKLSKDFVAVPPSDNCHSQ
jgi:hypothetical protein